MAEEAGKAVRWLCERGLDGCGSLARLLQQVDGGRVRLEMPKTSDGDLQAVNHAICPLVLGAFVSDSAATLETAPIVARGVAEPILLTPFVALASQGVQGLVTLHCDGADGSVLAGEVCLAGEFGERGEEVRIELGGSVDHPSARVTRATPRQEDWRVLEAFAHRTYAPATEQSRLSGAGAGVSDND